MASSASTDSVVKAGYWIFGKDSIRPLSEIPSELFTHLYAGFAKVDNDGRVIPDPYLELFQDFTRTVRVRNPTVKTLLSIGGEGADLSAVVASSDKRKNLITDSIGLARNFGFDGLDLCWMYPSNADQKDQLRDLLIEWRRALDEDSTKRKMPKPLLLTAAVFYRSVNNTFNYPIQAINEKLDWINVLAIDFYTPKSDSSPEETAPVHAWNSRPVQDDRCGRVGIEEWIKSGVVTNKLVLALPFYGYEWTLKNPISFSGFFAPAKSAKKDPVAYRDIQEAELRRGIYDSNYIAVYSHEINGDKWIGYDDALCISGKVSEARTRNLGGYFAWHLAADDDNWTLSKAASNAWDNAINNPGTTTTTTTTKTTNIGTTTTTTHTTNTGTNITTTTTTTNNTGTTATTITITTNAAASREGHIINNTNTGTTTTTTAAAAASGEGDINNDQQNSDSNYNYYY